MQNICTWEKLTEPDVHNLTPSPLLKPRTAKTEILVELSISKSEFLLN
jgi:hypothetical protein